MDYDFSSVMANPISLMQLMKAGFKFQPSPEELINNYLVPKSRGGIVEGVPMAEVNLCEHEPWDLPDKSIINLADQEWYFICPRDLKYKKSKLCNRKTKAGYWKSTCKIKPIMAEHTKKNIGVMKTLTFYKTARPKDVRTGWMIYEFDIVTNSSLSKKGQYVLCRLEKKSDEKTKKGEQDHHMASVSDSDAEPSQSMASNFENKNGSEMTVNSAFDATELSHHVASDHFEYQNSNELMNNSARQVSELSHHIASDFRYQNSNKLKSNSAYDGSGSLHSTSSNSKTQYWNQPTVDSAYNGSKRHYKAFDSETQNSNNMITMPIYENRLMAYEKWLMASDLKNQESPCGDATGLMIINQSTNNSEPSSLMAYDLRNQNLDKEIDISALDEDEWSSLTATPPDFGNQNPCKKTDMSTLEEGYSSNSTTSISDNNLGDVALPEVSRKALEKLEKLLEL